MKQTFILEVDSDTHPAVLTAKIRQELGLFIGKGSYVLSNADLEWVELGAYGEEAARLAKKQYLGCDPKVARSDLLRVDL